MKFNFRSLSKKKKYNWFGVHELLEYPYSSHGCTVNVGSSFTNSQTSRTTVVLLTVVTVVSVTHIPNVVSLYESPFHVYESRGTCKRSVLVPTGYGPVGPTSTCPTSVASTVPLISIVERGTIVSLFVSLVDIDWCSISKSLEKFF